ncbi:glycoside hydrolase [bacterium]|nr:glycoside hydrolase [bacterium]MBU1025829.1 glycoside hydrolase [bacterium]
MSRLSIFLLLLILSVVLSVSACSSPSKNPLEPATGDNINYPSSANELVDGRNFLGEYTMTFDPETWETQVTPSRDGDAVHVLITSYLYSPPCPAQGCFQFFITNWTGTVITIDLVLANPTSLAPYDVRQIFTALNGKKILNPDGYTKLYDPPSTPEEINPFIAYAKQKANRQFPAGPWSIIHETLLIDFPPGAYAATTFIFECSFGGNTEEPYVIKNQMQYGVLPDQGGWTVVLADIHDWQNDIEKATLDTIALNNRITNFSLIPQSNTYRAFVNNYLHSPVGVYPALIKAESTNPLGISMYHYVDIEVSEAPFSDNLPVSDCVDCDASTEGVGQRGIFINAPDVWITYSDNRAGAGVYNTRVQKSSNSGGTFGPSVKISTQASIMDTLPAIAVDGDYVYVTWTRANAFNYDVKFARSTDGGSTFGPEVRPHPDLYNSFQGNSHICVDGNGVVYIVYEDDSFGYGIDIALLVSTDHGATWSQPIRVNSDVTDKGQFSPAIAADLFGNAAIVWEDKRSSGGAFTHGDVYFTTTGNLGQTFGANIKVNDTNGTGLTDPAPAISLYLTGGVYLAWASDSMNDANIFFDYSPDRINFGTDARVNDDLANNAAQYDPSINVNLSGTVFIAWTDERNNHQDVFFAESHNPPNFGENYIVNTDTTQQNQFAPSITSDFLGRAYIIWSDARNTNSDTEQEVFFAFRR